MLMVKLTIKCLINYYTHAHTHAQFNNIISSINKATVTRYVDTKCREGGCLRLIYYKIVSIISRTQDIQHQTRVNRTTVFLYQVYYLRLTDQNGVHYNFMSQTHARARILFATKACI